MIVYRYGILAPTMNADLVREQMWLAHRYRNVLVEIERGRRAAVRLAMAQAGDVPALDATVTAAQAAEDEAVAAVKAARGGTRSMAVPVELRDRLRAARVVRRDAVRALREARSRLRDDETILAELVRIEGLAGELVRSARAYCGVFWGTYLLIEAAMDDSRAMPLFDGAGHNDPRFVRWVGEGRVGVQIQKGMGVPEVFTGEDRRLQIVRDALHPRPKRAPDWTRENLRMVERRGPVVRMRVGSNPDRSPIWAEFPMIMHRELPARGIIKEAAVSLRRIGPREEWSIQFTVDDAAVGVREPCGRGTVAIDIGWRQMDDGVRVAVWRGSDGGAGELRLPTYDVDGIAKAERVRSDRDKLFTTARDELVNWLRGGVQVPDWLAQATRFLFAWRSEDRLARVAGLWRQRRFDGDAGGYDRLEAWRYHDEHLWAWESSQRKGALRQRREVYRNFAAAMARRYGELVLEGDKKQKAGLMDLRAFAELPQVGEEPERDNQLARRNRHRMALSELRLCLCGALIARGGTKTTVPAERTTKTCNVCGVIEEWDQEKELRHTCVNGHEWDQDENASENMLRERLRAASDPETARGDGNGGGPPAKRESRWARAKRVKAEREAGKGTARDAVANPAE